MRTIASAMMLHSKTCSLQAPFAAAQRRSLATARAAPDAGAPPEPAKCPVTGLREAPAAPASLSFKFLVDAQQALKDTVAWAPISRLGDTIFISSAPLARRLLSQESSGGVLPGWPTATKELIGKQSRFTVPDPAAHRRLVQLMNPALNAAAVAAMQPGILRPAELALERLERLDGAALGMKEFARFSVEVVANTAVGLGLTEHEFEDFFSDVIKFSDQAFSTAPFNFWPFPFRHAMRARKRLAATIAAKAAVVRQRLAAAGGGQAPAQAPAGAPGGGVLEQLLTNVDHEGQPYSDDQVVDCVLDLLSAARDTTSALLCGLVLDLVRHPEALARLREEQAAVRRAHGDVVTAVALRDMVWADAMVKEALRRYPIGETGQRRTTRDVDVGGVRVPADSQVIISFTHITHTDPRWPADRLDPAHPMHPAAFNPNRWLEPPPRLDGQEGGAKPAAAGTQAPWGIGTRICAGIVLAPAQVKTVLALLARHYDVQADPNTKWNTIPDAPGPADGLPLRLTRRP